MSNIVYEKGQFYAIKLGDDAIEIRVNDIAYSYALGTAKTEAQARRFIDRMARYPERTADLIKRLKEG